MEFYHWFPTHPSLSELSGGLNKISNIGEEINSFDENDAHTSVQTDFRRISSVPDVWSQHRLFDMLLLNRSLDSAYEEYEQIAVREWRAMMAILVLSESYDVPIHTQTVNFAVQAENPYIQAAYSVRPNRDTWQSLEIYYIEKEDKKYPIAMSSPTVHVIPTKDAWESLRTVYPGKIPWLTSDFIYAPAMPDENKPDSYLPYLVETNRISAPAMLPIHALILHEWINNYVQNFDAESLDKSILMAYSTALAVAYNFNGQVLPNIKDILNTASLLTNLKIQGIKIPKVLRVFSETAFYSQIEQDSPLSRLPDTHKYAGGLGEECLFVFGRGLRSYTHYFVSMPVTDMLWALWESNLNLNPTYQLVCEAPDRNLELTCITVKIKIGDLSFQQTYESNRIEKDYWRNLCTIGLWPRQKINGWNEYSIFCYENNEYHIKPLINDDDYHQCSYEKRIGLDAKTTYFTMTKSPNHCLLFRGRKPLGYISIRTTQNIEKGDISKIYHSSIDFGTSSTTLYGYTEGREEEGKLIDGMSFWSLPIINTYEADGSDSSVFAKYFFPILPDPIEKAGKQSNNDSLKELDYYKLIKTPNVADNYPRSIPMQSILADAVTTNAARQALAESWIYFRNFSPKRDAEIDKWPNLYSDIKWHRDQSIGQRRVEVLLSQILLLIALEARCNNCAKIAITASYPLSFNQQTRDSYYKALSDMLGQIEGLTGLEIQLPDPNDRHKKVTRITESEAAFRYAYKKKKAVSYYVVDIGGGSTDIYISLIDKNSSRRSFSTSIGVGARKMLLKKLRANDKRDLRLIVNNADDGIKKIILDTDAYIDEIRDENGDSLIEDLFTMRIPPKSGIAAALLETAFGDAFTAFCASQNNENIALVSLKKRIAFYLGATIFCSGLMLRGEEALYNNVSILFAGNGSKMIHWLDNADDSKIRFIYTVFKAGLDTDIGKDDFKCVFSDEPKCEVANGALLPVPALFKEGGNVLCQVFFGNGEFKEDQVITHQDLQYERKDVNATRKEMEDYLRIFRKAAKACFGWGFDDDEYSPKLLDIPYIEQLTMMEMKKGASYLLSATEAISEFYLQ
jgi:cytochrome c-type biogenesis protein CcmE